MFVDRSSNAPRRLFIRLDPGEEVIATLAALLEEQGAYISAGSITGIGSVRNAELGFFDSAKGAYARRTLQEEMELVSFVGNVSWLDGKPFVHAHAVLSGAEFRPFAGHLFAAEIAVTGEFFYVEGGRKLKREEDRARGLKLIVG